MGESTHNSHVQPAAGQGDMGEHVKTYQAFVTGTKWSVIGIIIIAVLLAIFRTHNGLPLP